MNAKENNPQIMRLFSSFLIGSLLAIGPVSAQAPVTANTLALSDSTSGMDVPIEALAMLEGTWQGEGFGGIVDEIWTGPAGGQMHGLFRIVGEAGIVLSEHMVIDTMDGRPTLRVKHFSAEFEGWEGQAESVNFPLIRADRDALYFEGLTVRKTEGGLDYFLAMQTADGWQEEILSYREK
jgi:hypothetical protein